MEEELNSSITLLMKMIADRGAAIFSGENVLPMTSSQCRVVLYLESCGGGPVPQRKIERHLGITHATAKGLLQRLEKKGFLRTAFDSADGRVKNVYLTEQCLQLKEQVRERAARVTGRMLHGLSLEERRQLADMLGRIYDNIKC